MHRRTAQSLCVFRYFSSFRLSSYLLISAQYYQTLLPGILTMAKGKRSVTQATNRDEDAAASGTKRTCIVCRADFPTSDVLAVRHCKHMLCRRCLTLYFQLAPHTPTLFPAKCCKMPIPLEDAERYIPKDIMKRYKAKLAEHSAEDPTYCHVQNCSAFIPSYSVYDKQAVCPKCLASTCAGCKRECHRGPCITTEDAQVMQLAKLMWWRQCPGCGHLVEQVEGCSHMRCAFHPPQLRF